jgi:hypothetical protein
MGILGSNGKSVTPGTPCIYYLISGQILFSECAKEDGESFVFDGDKTLEVTLSRGSGHSVQAGMSKVSDIGFKSKQVRVMKHAVLLISDCGETTLINKAHEVLSGLVLPSQN